MLPHGTRPTAEGEGGAHEPWGHPIGALEAPPRPRPSPPEAPRAVIFITCGAGTSIINRAEIRPPTPARAWVLFPIGKKTPHSGREAAPCHPWPPLLLAPRVPERFMTQAFLKPDWGRRPQAARGCGCCWEGASEGRGAGPSARPPASRQALTRTGDGTLALGETYANSQSGTCFEKTGSDSPFCDPRTSLPAFAWRS